MINKDYFPSLNFLITLGQHRRAPSLPVIKNRTSKQKIQNSSFLSLCSVWISVTFTNSISGSAYYVALHTCLL